ncbi:MAG TPA: benzoate-CoA ligase family protein [Ktedonobacterales bacterium]|nr:benzoate-CoA ligase family protein [Ktedonobacterales bacterium]
MVQPSSSTSSTAGSTAQSLPDEYNVTAVFLDGALARGWGSQPAIRTETETWTYAQLAEQAHRAGNGLAALGAEMEHRVAILLYDSPEFAATFFGAIRLGAVAVPFNTQLRPQDYLYLLNDSRARLLVAEADLWEKIAPLRRQMPFLRHVVLVHRDGAATGHDPSTVDYAALLSGASATLATAPTTRDDAALWLYSSGSTGFPKGCVHLQHDMEYCVEHYAKPILQLTPDDITFSAAKLFFAYGLGNGLYFPLATGASSILYPGRVTPEAAFRVISQQRPTIFFGVPTLYAAMLAMPDAAEKYDTSSLRLCVSAGESLPAELFTRWKERFGVEILDGIGSTEILHIFISNVAGNVVPGSSGQLVPGYEAKIVDEQGQPVAQGEIGNLLIAGDSICSQYWNKHERSKATITGQWIATGDKYYQDDKGNYWYGGRSDDMLKVSGQWVSPVEVEASLVAYPAVLEAAVVGAEDNDGLVKPYAFVVLKPDQPASEAMREMLKQHVKTTLQPHKYPRWVSFATELPKTATGKIQRYRLREQLAASKEEVGSATTNSH